MDRLNECQPESGDLASDKTQEPVCITDDGIGSRSKPVSNYWKHNQNTTTDTSSSTQLILENSVHESLMTDNSLHDRKRANMDSINDHTFITHHSPQGAHELSSLPSSTGDEEVKITGMSAPTKSDRPSHIKYSIANVEDNNDYEICNDSTKSSSNGKGKKIIKIKRIDEQERLNIYAYHRGIAGYEPRELGSGRLLFDVEPTDTNHAWLEPQMKCLVTICIPLGVSEYTSTQHYVLEKVEWDLSNPKTKSPLVFATDIAVEYGLTPAKILDLASSIQNQIDHFLRLRSCYRIPITLNDPVGVERTDEQLKQNPGFLFPRTLHGGCNATSITPMVQITNQQGGTLDHIQMSKSRKASSLSSTMKGNPRSNNTLQSSVSRKHPEISSTHRMSGESSSSFKGFQGKGISEKKSAEPKIQISRELSSPSAIKKLTPKIPTTEFPRELEDIYDVDPSQPDDYRTAFTREGQVLISDHNPDRYEFVITEKVYEDFEPSGDCMICQTFGLHMWRCTKCSRLFHQDCIQRKGGGDGDCPKCQNDDLSIEVSGSDYIETLENGYREFSAESEYIQNIHILSKIVAIIDTLMLYDFGNVFAVPVDLMAYPDYARKIKNPRDLGTIRNSVMNGEYGKNASSSDGSEDLSKINSIILETLKDIETIWYNCSSYNVEGELNTEIKRI